MDWIHDYPPWIVGIVTIAAFTGAAFVGLSASRRWSRRRGLHALVDNGVIGWIFSAILGIYAISIGLIAIASWGNASQAASVASHEAAAIAAFFGDLGGYPEPLRSDVQGMLAEYTRNVINEAWPRQRRGEMPHRGTEILTRLQERLYAFEPASAGQEVIHGEALRAFNHLAENRRLRIEAIDYAVPGTLWSVVLVGGVISVVASFVFAMESFPVHAFMTCLLAAMIGLIVFFIAVTDLPYRGPGSVDADAYEFVLHDLIENHQIR